MTKYEFRWAIQPADSGAWPEKKTWDGFEVEVAESEIILRINSAEKEEKLTARARAIAQSLLEALSHQEGRKLTSSVFRVGKTPPSGPRHNGLNIGESGPEMKDKFEWTVEASFGADAYIVTDSQSVAADESFNLARRIQKSAPLRQMANNMTKFREDPEKKLAPLYDIIETAETELGGERRAPGALGMKDKDWKEAKRIMNDGAILTSRHPGEGSGPKHAITEEEFTRCVETADRIIQAFAARIPV